MQIFIKSFNGKTITLDVSSAETIKSIKSLIYKNTKTMLICFILERIYRKKKKKKDREGLIYNNDNKFKYNS